MVCIPNSLRRSLQNGLNLQCLLFNLNSGSLFIQAQCTVSFITARSKFRERFQFLPEYYMYVLFEEDGAFKTGHILSEADSALQIESGTGKRSKIKANVVLLRFESALATLLPEAEKLSLAIDPDFLYEVCGDAEFAFDELALDYYGHKPSAAGWHCG